MDAVTSLIAGGNTMVQCLKIALGNVAVKKARSRSGLLMQHVAQAVP